MRTTPKILSAAALVSALSACSMMPDQRAEGLPPLQVTEHVVEPDEIFGHCRDVMTWWHWALLALPMACATINFEKRTCDIYVATNSAPDTVEHERRHCQGYDHGGRIEAAYKTWLAARQQAVSSPEEAPAAAGETGVATRLVQNRWGRPIPNVP